MIGQKQRMMLETESDDDMIGRVEKTCSMESGCKPDVTLRS